MSEETQPTILYIDDTPAALELVSRVLTAEGFEVRTASDALRGIELAVEVEPDLVLLDINLPHFSGREAATRLRSLLPGTPLVAFTADTSPGAKQRALAAGCMGFLNKPLNVDSFADELRAFMGGKRETLPNAQDASRAYQAELVEELEAKVRALTQAMEHNDYLNQQNEQMVADLKRRQHLLEAAARVSQNITLILDLDELLRRTVDIICEEYTFYYAAIFLLDERGEWAVLRAGRGAAGRAMMAAGHKLAVGGNSMIGAATGRREARIALNVGEEAVHFKNPYLPDTRSEMALPLLVKDEVLGALSVQSDQLNAFGDDDIAALQTLANQVAVALHNARLVQELASANEELLRTKTFEAIATATGEAIHWVGNKAAPIPSAARRVREDVGQVLALLYRLLQEPAEQRETHPFWSLAQQWWAEAHEGGVDLAALAEELAHGPGWKLGVLGGVASILEDLEIAEKSAATILNIKEDLIGPARLRQTRLIWLPELLHDTITSMGLPTGVVERDFGPVPLVRGDERQLNQLFNNLIKNAWEALAAAPEPAIIVRAHTLPDDANWVLIKVADNGPGIPPELLDRIWVSFFTTKGDRGGTGLGLSACMEIVKQSGGKMTVESEVGVGTTFNVLLPAAADPASGEEAEGPGDGEDWAVEPFPQGERG